MPIIILLKRCYGTGNGTCNYFKFYILNFKLAVAPPPSFKESANEYQNFDLNMLL